MYDSNRTEGHLGFDRSDKHNFGFLMVLRVHGTVAFEFLQSNPPVTNVRCCLILR